jgi:uncharacterized protein YdaU (DUF1376 family)
MAEFPAMPLWTDAYIGDTLHLTLEQHGAYLKLLMIAWRTPDCSIPDDDALIARMLSVTPARWAKLRPVVLSFWRLEGGRFTQKKLTEGREKLAKNKEQKSSAGKRSVASKALKLQDRTSTAVPTDMPTNPQQKLNNHNHNHNHNHNQLPPHTPLADEDNLSFDGKHPDRGEHLAPNQSAQREEIIAIVKSFHISRPNAVALVDGSYPHISWFDLKRLLADAKIAGASRENLEAELISAVRTAKAAAMPPGPEIATDQIQIWESANKYLKTKLTPAIYRSSIDMMKFTGIKNAAATFKTDKLIIRNHLMKEYSVIIMDAFKHATDGDITEISITTLEDKSCR